MIKIIKKIKIMLGFTFEDSDGKTWVIKKVNAECLSEDGKEAKTFALTDEGKLC